MTTEPEARAFLTDLTRLAQALDDAVLDSGLPAASRENAGIARSLPESKCPCSDSLGDMRRDALAYVEQWAGNLSSDLTIWQSDTEKTGPTLTPWVRWLHRHRVDLIARPWWPDAEGELRDKVHRPLADQFTPPSPPARTCPPAPSHPASPSRKCATHSTSGQRPSGHGRTGTRSATQVLRSASSSAVKPNTTACSNAAMEHPGPPHEHTVPAPTVHRAH